MAASGLLYMLYAELQSIFSYKKENIAPLGHFSMMSDNEYLVI